MEMQDRQQSEDEVSPSGTVRFPDLEPVRLHLADHIADSPALWQVWNSGSQPRTEMVLRLDEDPEELPAVLRALHSAAGSLPAQVRDHHPIH